MSDKRKLFRWARCGALLLGILLAITIIGALSLNQAERVRNAEQDYAVFSAYLSESILKDAHDWSVDVPIQVVIQGTTTRRTLSHLRVPLQMSTRLSFFVRNLFRVQLQSEFRLPGRAIPVLAVTEDAGLEELQRRFPNSLGYVTFSSVGFNRRQTQAVFFYEHFCGLCGGGGYVIMEKVNGLWKIGDEHFLWVS